MSHERGDMRIARLVLVIVAALATPLVFAAACPPKSKPEKVVITAAAVQICLDDTTLVRQEDARCDEGLSSFHWVYVTDDPDWPAELPAVGEYIQGGRASIKVPSGVAISRIPREGARFVPL